MGNIQSNATRRLLAAYSDVVNNTVNDVFYSVAMICENTNKFQLQAGTDCKLFAILSPSIHLLPQVNGTNCRLDNDKIKTLMPVFRTLLIQNTRQFIQQNIDNNGWFHTAYTLQTNASTVQFRDQIMMQMSDSYNDACTYVNNDLNNNLVKLCGIYNGNFNFTQNALLLALISCVNRNVINQWTTNTQLNNLWQQTDSKLFNSQEMYNGESESEIFNIREDFLGITQADDRICFSYYAIFWLIVIIIIVVLLYRMNVIHY